MSFGRIDLEDEQNDTLSRMVDAERDPKRRASWILVQSGQGRDTLIQRIGGDTRFEVTKGDLEELAERGYLRVDFGSGGNPLYEVTVSGRGYDAERRKLAGEAIQVVEDTVRRFLEAEPFRTSYREAYERWRQAEQEMWDAETLADFTDIGHGCREAMQNFVSRLVAESNATDAPHDAKMTASRLRAVVKVKGPTGRRGELLDVLIEYWRSVAALVERQEHGALKEGESLTWEDARRVVFQTAIVMFEVARALRDL